MVGTASRTPRRASFREIQGAHDTGAGARGNCASLFPRFETFPFQTTSCVSSRSVVFAPVAEDGREARRKRLPQCARRQRARRRCARRERLGALCARFPRALKRHCATTPSMELSILSGDELEVIFLGLCNPFDTRVAMAFGSASRGLCCATQVARQQLRVQSDAAAALCQRAGIPSCKKLREATTARWSNTELSIAELAMLGALGSVVPTLRSLYLFDNVAEPGGMQRLAEGLGAGSLPCVTRLVLGSMRMGDAGAVALAAALGRGALARLEALSLGDNGIGDAGLVALAPALRRLPALKQLWLVGTSLCRKLGRARFGQNSAETGPSEPGGAQVAPRRGQPHSQLLGSPPLIGPH